jgi:hypothetical protein
MANILLFAMVNHSSAFRRIPKSQAQQELVLVAHTSLCRSPMLIRLACSTRLAQAIAVHESPRTTKLYDATRGPDTKVF